MERISGQGNPDQDCCDVLHVSITGGKEYYVVTDSQGRIVETKSVPFPESLVSLLYTTLTGLDRTSQMAVRSIRHTAMIAFLRLRRACGQGWKPLFSRSICAFIPEGWVFLPKGALPSEEASRGFGMDYGDDLRAIFQDWALPD